MVENMLALDQSRVDKQFQIKTKLEWKCDAYREVNLMLRNFREAHMSVLNPDSNMLSTSAYNIFQVTMLDTTNAVAVSADSTAVAGQMTIDSISQLAEAASVKSVGAFDGETMYMDTALKDLELTVPLQFESGEISFSINGEIFTFSEDTTINELISTVNGNVNTGVGLSYSSLTKGFTITSKTTGSGSTIEIQNLAGNAFAAVDSAFGISEGTVNGQDAMLSIEGIAVVRSSNTFTIDGISYTLKDESAAPISFNVERDIDSTFMKIKNFIDSYNELISNLQEKIEEPVYRDYPPLTDEQRGVLTETQMNKWDELSKSGLLHNDSSISGLLNMMRSAFYTVVDGIEKFPADIGLQTGLYYEKGKITVNESLLRSALENNPDEVANLFIKQPVSEAPAEKFSQSGLVMRISDAVTQCTERINETAIGSAQRSIRYAKTRMNELMDRMTTKEEALWAKFTAMETAMAKMNSQTAWLNSQLSAFAQQ